jgi:hypothetical protein
MGPNLSALSTLSTAFSALVISLSTADAGLGFECREGESLGYGRKKHAAAKTRVPRRMTLSTG